MRADLTEIMMPIDGRSNKTNRRDAGRSLVAWLSIFNYPKTSIPKLKSLFCNALDNIEFDADPDLSSLFRNQEFMALLHAENDRITYAQRLISVLKDIAEDSLELRLQEQTFSFTEINPGLGAFGLASINIGGVPHGSNLVSPMARPTFRENRGSDSLVETNSFVDLCLVNLPFSVFLNGGKTDPALTRFVDAASNFRNRSKCTIFRVDWTIGQRLGLNPSSYTDLIANYFRDFEVHSMVMDVEWFVPMEGYELFIAVSQSFNSPVRPVVAEIIPKLASSFVEKTKTTETVFVKNSINSRKFPRQHASRIDCDYWHDPSAALVKTDHGHRMLTVNEVKKLLGIDPEFKVPTHDETSYHLLGDSVVVPVAERAILGVLRALR
jgi:hypothetical protein